MPPLTPFFGENPSRRVHFSYIFTFFSTMVRYMGKYTRIKNIWNKILHKFISIHYSCKCDSFYANQPASRNTSGARRNFIIMLSTTDLGVQFYCKAPIREGKMYLKCHIPRVSTRVPKCAVKLYLMKTLNMVFVSSQLHLYHT